MTAINILRQRAAVHIMTDAASWPTTKLVDSDHVVFFSRPGNGLRGSTTGKVIGLVSLIALAAVAGPLGSGIATALFSGPFATVIGGAIGAGFIFGGALLIDALADRYQPVASHLDDESSLPAPGSRPNSDKHDAQSSSSHHRCAQSCEAATNLQGGNRDG
jgi:hypothetical protein